MSAPDVPYIVYEGERARHEREARRLQILAGGLAAVVVLSNLIWVVCI